MTLRLRRIRWAAGASGMVSAIGFDAGKSASKNNVADRSQKSIAALSIGLFLSRGRNAMRDARNCRRRPLREYTGLAKSNLSEP
jgi:predicted kinase